MPAPPQATKRSFLFLQGPLSPLYARVGKALEGKGHTVVRINLCVGDWLYWRSSALNFRGAAERWPLFVERTMVAYGTTDVVLHGDCRPYHVAAAKVARRMGLRVHVTELGYLRPDWMTLEREATGAGSHFPRDPLVIARLAADLPLVDLRPRYETSFAKVAIPDVVYNLSNTLLWFLYPHYRRHTIYFPPLEYTAWLMRLATKRSRETAAARILDDLARSRGRYFILALQLEGDYQIRHSSSFGSLALALDHVVSSFAAHAPGDEILVVKSHPLDNGLERWPVEVRRLGARYGVAKRLRFVDGGRLVDSLWGARGVLSVNSGAGLEALQRGIPTKVLAPAVYDVDGLVHKGALETFWTSPVGPDPKLLDQFLRALIARTQVRGTIYSRDGLSAAVDGIVQRLLASTSETEVASPS